MKCSKKLWVLTFLMMGFPVIYPFFLYFAFDVGTKGVLSVGLSPLFYLASALWVMTGTGLRSLRHWSWYTFGAAQTLTTYLNALSLVNLSASEYKSFVFVGTILAQALFHSIVARDIRVPYLFPRIKWWESGIAGMHHITAEIVLSTPGSPIHIGQLLDLSLKGCFIKSPFDFDQDSGVTILLKAYEQEVRLPGKIVWNAKSTVTHPKGVGVQFGLLEKATRKKLRSIAKQFDEQKDLPVGLNIISS